MRVNEITNNTDLNDLKDNSRAEADLVEMVNKLYGEAGGTLPVPKSRMEFLLHAIYEKLGEGGGGGSVDPADIETVVRAWFEEHSEAVATGFNVEFVDDGIEFTNDQMSVEEVVAEYLDDHPEATTTVQDGAISYAKLDSNLKAKADDVSELKSQVSALDAAVEELETGSLSALGATEGQVPVADGEGSWDWQDQQSGGGIASSEPHNYAFDGKDLSTVFADADALYTAYSQEDYSKIHIGDYWPVILNGTYRDYGSYSAPIGTSYYSDTALTNKIGETSEVYEATGVQNTNIAGCHESYCTIKIGSTTYYVALSDCLDYRERTLSNATMLFEVAGINQYWRYGDAGANNFHNGVPHLLLSSRDGLPHTLKMRKLNELWENQTIDTFTGDGTTAEFTPSGTVGTIGYVFVDGSRKTYNTDYMFGSNKVTFKSGKIPTNGVSIQIEWMPDKTPWTGSALYRTLNDPDYGIIKLIEQADSKLYNHIYKGPNSSGMRYYGETRTKTNNQSGAWEDRGLLFLPTEDEIWGRQIRSTGSDLSTNQQQWPIYAISGRRHFAKGVGNAASRNGVWTSSSTSVTGFAFVGSTGTPDNSRAANALATAPAFLLT